MAIPTTITKMNSRSQPSHSLCLISAIRLSSDLVERVKCKVERVKCKVESVKYNVESIMLIAQPLKDYP